MKDWILRIGFIIFPIVVFGSIGLIDKEIIPLTLGFGFLFVAASYSMLSKAWKGYKKFENIVRNTSLIVGLSLIIGSFIRIDQEIITYKNSDGYSIQQGSHPNDSIPSSFMLYVDETSKILDDNNLMIFSSGSWFLYVGYPADTNLFKIVVKKNMYLTGPRTYVKFLYDSKELDSIKTKFQYERINKF